MSLNLIKGSAMSFRKSLMLEINGLGVLWWLYEIFGVIEPKIKCTKKSKTDDQKHVYENMAN